MPRPAIVIAALVLAACGAENSSEASSTLKVHRGEIINGYATSGFHEVVKISRFDPTYPGGATEFCTGTLIASRTVLTAAHCTQAYNGSDYPTVTVSGKYFEYERELRRWYGPFPYSVEASTISRHPYVDLAVLTLPYAITGVTPGALATSVSSTLPITLVGFGATSGDSPYPNYGGEKRYGFNTIHSTDDIYLYFDGATGTDSATCYGDSGGPAFRQGTSCVLGVTKGQPTATQATACTEAGGLFAHTRVDNFAAWIRSQTTQSIASCIP